MNKEILEITKNFHDTYEKLASEYAYKTREDTKVFNINSNNGKLMYTTVNEIVNPILKENQELKKQLHDASIQIQELIEKDIWCPSNCEKLEKLQQENKQLKDNWNKLKEWLKEYEEGTYGLGSYETGLSDGLRDVIKKMQELEGSDSDE